jgi:hypothetical protein
MDTKGWLEIYMYSSYLAVKNRGIQLWTIGHIQLPGCSITGIPNHLATQTV